MNDGAIFIKARPFIREKLDVLGWDVWDTNDRNFLRRRYRSNRQVDRMNRSAARTEILWYAWEKQMAVKMVKEK